MMKGGAPRSAHWGTRGEPGQDAHGRPKEGCALKRDQHHQGARTSTHALRGTPGDTPIMVYKLSRVAARTVEPSCCKRGDSRATEDRGEDDAGER